MQMIGHDYPFIQANPRKMFGNVLPALRDNLADRRRLRLVISNLSQGRLLVMSANGDEEKSSEGVIVAAKSDGASFFLIKVHLGKLARHAVPLHLLLWI